MVKTQTTASSPRVVSLQPDQDLNQNSKKLLFQCTSNGGILIIDKNGSIVQHLHKGNGLLDNIIYCLYVDQNQNLWAGLSKGIAHIQVNSPFSVFDASMGLDGATYNTLVSQNRLIVATSSGIYYKNWKPYENPIDDSTRFQTFPNSKRQVWQLKAFKGEILAAYNPGLYRIEDKNPAWVNADVPKIPSNVWTRIPVLENPNYIMIGTIGGLALLEWKDNHWQFKHTIKGFSSSTRYLGMKQK